MVVVRDRLGAFNERVKLFCGFLNALALGLVGFAVLRPLTDDPLSLDVASAGWGLAGLAIHGLAHYFLRYVRKEATDDGV